MIIGGPDVRPRRTPMRTKAELGLVLRDRRTWMHTHRHHAYANANAERIYREKVHECEYHLAIRNAYLISTDAHIVTQVTSTTDIL